MEHFKIKDLSFTYPQCEKVVLNNINLSVNKGDYILICGKSGSGKTTLLKHLKTTLAPFGKKTGEVYFEGKILEEVDLYNQSSQIGYVMQNPDNQIVTDKVWHELAFGLENLGLEQSKIRARVAEIASYFGIQELFHRNIQELSGGQKQLLNLASIMAMQPSVLILDEPTSQLDPIAAVDFLNTIKKINLELGTTIIISEHRLEDIYHVSDMVVVLEGGAIIEHASPKEVAVNLCVKQNAMYYALPSPIQIAYAVGESKELPLTVREGRNWLSDKVQNNSLQFTKIEQNNSGSVNNTVVLQIKEAWFRYDKNAKDILKGLSMEVLEGELYAIVGGNGVGKSTLLQALCKINPIYRGSIKIQGKEIRKYKGNTLFQSNLAMLPQNPLSLFVKKTVKEELIEVIKNKNDLMQMQEIASLCEVDNLFNSHPYDLSGGEAQRVALAKVLLTNPKILLLDEPTKGIDSFFKIKFASILNKLKDQGVTIIMVTHDIEFCARHADRVSMFFDGDIITTARTNDFFASNSFYTSSANRMSRHVFENAIKNEEVIELCKRNQM